MSCGEYILDDVYAKGFLWSFLICSGLWQNQQTLPTTTQHPAALAMMGALVWCRERTVVARRVGTMRSSAVVSGPAAATSARALLACLHTHLPEHDGSNCVPQML